MGPILGTEMSAEGREDGRPTHRYGDPEWRDLRPNGDSAAAKKAFAAATAQSKNGRHFTAPAHRSVDV